MKRSNADSIGAKRERRFKRRAILITEGAKIEIGYFKAFTDSREALGINDLIDVVLLDRFHQDVGLSDPLRILDLSKEYMHASRTDVCPLNLFVGMCAESAEGHVSDIKGVRESLRRRLMGAGLVLDGFIRDIEHAKDIAAELLFEEGIEDISITYSVVKTTVDDPVYIIVDRDMSDSRSSEKYSDFISRCNDEGFIPIVTNPNFELWILAHMDDPSEDIRRVADSQNPASTLRRVMDGRGYSKKSAHFGDIVFKLDDACRECSVLEHDVNCLEHNVGTNLPSMVDDLRSDIRREGRFVRTPIPLEHTVLGGLI